MIDRRSLLAGAAGFAATVTSAGLPRSGALAQAAGHPRELRIGFQRNGLLLLGKHQGVIDERFRQLGVTVRWVEFQFGPPLLEALNVGSIDYGTTGDAPPIFAQAANAGILYVAAQESAGSGAGILVPPNSAIQRLEDLRGKRIGFARASSSHALTIAALDKVGIPWDAITPVQLPPADARAAFEQGSLDAWTIWDPFFAVAEGRPGVRVLATARGIARQNSYFLASRDFVTKHPQTVAVLNEELVKLARFAGDNRGELARLFAEATRIDLAPWQRAVDRTDYAVGPVTASVIEEQQRVADRFHRLGLIPNRIDVSRIVWNWTPST